MSRCRLSRAVAKSLKAPLGLGDDAAPPTLSPGRLPANLTVLVPGRRRRSPAAAIVVFVSGLFAKSFEDEYAYISQSYYADLFFAGHDSRTRLGSTFPAYDLPPLPKYLIGLAFRSGAAPHADRPRRRWDWYDHYGHFGTPLTLCVARLPIIVVGALGCVAIFALRCL